jgi:hypothetical protein
MNYPTACNILASVNDPAIGRATINFVSPIVSAVSAAACTADAAIRDKFDFSSDARTYAANNGLLAAIAGDYQPPAGAGQQGVTYCPLTRLRYAVEVEACNRTIADLLYAQLGHGDKVTQLAQVVGELHDNVASHASGVGFSSAQVYSKNNRKRLEFGIVDNGCGMLENARRTDAGVTTDQDAISWCMKRGNTSAAVVDDFWAQRVPDDGGPAPFGGPTYVDAGGSHHAGLGLFNLRRLVRLFGGRLWIWTGSSQIVYSGGVRNFAATVSRWRGVALEFEVTIPEGRPIAEPILTDDEHGDLNQIFG